MGMTIPDVSRRGFLTGLRKAAIVGTAALLLKPDKSQAAGPGVPWTCMSQWQRHDWLVEVALRDVGRQYPPNCKEWVRKVVYEASGYGGDTPVTIPPTYPNDSGWSWYYHPRTPQMSKTLRQVITGEVIQMNWGAMPHTTIVGRITTYGCYFIDCNFPRWLGDINSGYIQNHWVSWSEMEAKISNRYTVYQIR